MQIRGDSLLVIYQVLDEYQCSAESLKAYWFRAKHLLKGFSKVWIEYVERGSNPEANDAAQHASGFKIQTDKPSFRKSYPCLHTPETEKLKIDITKDWRTEIINWLKEPDPSNRRLKTLCLSYVILAETLYKRGPYGVLLRCLGPRGLYW